MFRVARFEALEDVQNVTESINERVPPTRREVDETGHRAAHLVMSSLQRFDAPPEIRKVLLEEGEEAFLLPPKVVQQGVPQEL